MPKLTPDTSPGDEQLDEILKAFEVAMFDIVGDEFAPKQEHGSPERKRLLGLLAKVYPEFAEAKDRLNRLMLTRERERLAAIFIQSDGHNTLKLIDDAIDAIDAQLNKEENHG